MDYEQKYKKALEMAREAFYNQETPYVAKAWLLTMFPTIAESTGERIRKGIIELVKQSSEVLDKQNQKDMIDWLEKQGKNKKVSIWKHWKNGIAGNGEGRQIYLIKVGNTYDLSSCLSFECDYIELSELDNLMLETQGEQSVEPKWCHHKVDLSDCSEEYRKAYYDGWNNCNMQHSQCKTESNDKDEKMKKAIMHILYENYTDAAVIEGVEIAEIVAWLEKNNHE